MPIIEREIVTEGFETQTGKRIARVNRIHRTYVKPNKVRPGDIVVTQKKQEVEITIPARGRKKARVKTRTIDKLSEKELLDPRVRAELGLESLELDEGDDDFEEQGTVRVLDQDEEEELGEDEEEDEEGEETPLERFVARWEDAVEIIRQAAGAQNVDLLAELHAAEMRRSKPRPSVVKAFADAGLGDPADFKK